MRCTVERSLARPIGRFSQGGNVPKRVDGGDSVFEDGTDGVITRWVSLGKIDEYSDHTKSYLESEVFSAAGKQNSSSGRGRRLETKRLLRHERCQSPTFMILRRLF